MRKIIAAFFVLFVFILVFENQFINAKENKPETPDVEYLVRNNQKEVKIVIYTSESAQGYKVMLKAPGKKKYKCIKTFKMYEDAVKFGYTVKDLKKGTYTFKVKAYSKVNGKTIWSSSKAKKIKISNKKDTSTPTPTPKVTSTPIPMPKVTPTPTLTPVPTSSPTSTPIPTPIPTSKPSLDFSSVNKGDVITFGKYEQDMNYDNGKDPIEWIVLSKDNSEMLLFSKYILDQHDFAYFRNDEDDVNWKNSELREWLNSDFYNAAFSKEEKEYIINTKVDYSSYYMYTDRNKYDQSEKQYVNDNVFILSYFDLLDPSYGFDSSCDAKDVKRLCAPTKYAATLISNYYNKEGGYVNTRTEEGKLSYNYYVRPLGAECETLSAVMFDGTVAGFSDDILSATVGVRPAIKIRIKAE